MRVYVYQIQNSLQMSEFCWSDLTLHPVPLLAIASTTHPLKRHVSLDALVSPVSKSGGWYFLTRVWACLINIRRHNKSMANWKNPPLLSVDSCWVGGFIRGYTHYSPCMSKSIYLYGFLLFFCDEVPQHTEHLPEQNNSSHSLTFYWDPVSAVKHPPSPPFIYRYLIHLFLNHYFKFREAII